MRVGLIARADDRGIGTMTHEFHRNLSPAATLVVREPGAEARGFPAHLDRYPGAEVVIFDPRTGSLPERECREFLAQVDVVYMVETPYDFALFRWAREEGTATVLHAMPEFWRWDDGTFDRPDVWWLPTRWRADLLPAECRLVPVPCPSRPIGHLALDVGSPVRFVHTAGHRALGDRNGTTLLYQAIRSIRGPVSIRVETQDPRLPTLRRIPGVNLDVHLGGRQDRWAVYDDADVLVLPRRYGGLCLPVLEAMAAGLAIVMPDVEPQRSEWPVFTIPCEPARPIEMAAGMIHPVAVDPVFLAATITGLGKDREIVQSYREASLRWARLNDWAVLGPLYLDELRRACS